MRRDHVKIGGKDEVHAEGSYYLEWLSLGARSREAAGPDAFIAAERAHRKQAELSAARSGLIDLHVPPPDPERITLADALDKHREYIRYHRSLRTFRTYRPILNSFGLFCKRRYVDEIEREDLLDFAALCLKQTQKGRSAYNKLVVISQLLKQNGRPRLLNASDWPSYVDTVRPIYESAELEKLFTACSVEEGMRFKFYLMTGFRDAEGRFATWRDVDFKQMAVRVTAKPKLGFQPKNWEEREVPVPQKLISLLAKFKPEDAGLDDFIFSSGSGRQDGAMLEKLKIVAWRAKLNCGRCVTTHDLDDGTKRTNRCSAGAFCTRWFLHKLRHTYATRHLQDGVDIRTLQQWMGHRDTASTMVYLKGVRNSDMQARLNKGSMAAFA